MNANDHAYARPADAAAEEHYRLLADHVADVVLRLEPDLTITWISPSVRHILGMEPDEIVGRNGAEFVEPDVWDALPDPRDDVLAGAVPDGPELPMYIRVRHADGSWRWMAGRPVLVTDDHGSLTSIVIAWSDVTELIEAREEAHEARDRLRATLDTLIDPHIIISPLVEDGRIVDFVILEANQAVATYYQRPRSELVGARYLDVMTTHAALAVFPLDVTVAETGVPLVLDDFPLELHGVERRFDLRAVRVGGDVSHTWRDVTHRHDVEVHLSHLATHDTLTGLANRGALIDELSRALIAARRSGQPVAVIMLDLDHFKTVNDTVGHAMGDQLLKAAARRLEAGVRGGDLVARLGGDEFVVVMRDLDGVEEAGRVAARLVDAIRVPMVVGDVELHPSASIGVAVSRHTEGGSDELLREADAALYVAKAQGRGRCALHAA
jgi:diguanylate cyclase (GGDEF)-like protein/PAS domain S-box-containing protein